MASHLLQTEIPQVELNLLLSLTNILGSRTAIIGAAITCFGKKLQAARHLKCFSCLQVSHILQN